VCVSELVADTEGAADVDVGPFSVPDEQPASATVAAAASQMGYLRIQPIYATLAAVMQVTGYRECCQA
jgi:hypothetical protein